jgi:outer membrane translocation and assembly module TamA
MNLEERMYLGREIMQLASPAVVAFIDSGNATYGGMSDLLAFKTDLGVGIRIGLPRTPRNVLRIDFAYALNRDPLLRRGWIVSFSSGQAF